MIYSRLISLGLLWMLITPLGAEENQTFRAGFAKADITPKQSMWLAGYGGRDHPSEGVLHPIWVKTISIEDAHGERLVLATTDLCGMPKWMYDSICEKVEKKHKLGRSRVRITNSHNHCAPAVRGDLEDYYPLDDEQRKRVYEYSDWLEGEILKTIDESLEKMEPVQITAGVGQCGFAVNRRNNKEAEVSEIRARGEMLKGPVNHDVPVLALRSEQGELKAVVFAYACHSTTLSFYQFCGDYAGFAQIALEKAHPSAMALFVAGCGGDQNPLPRRTVELCEKYGNELAQGVEKVLAGSMRPLVPKVRAEFEFVDLEFDGNPSKQALEQYSQGTNPIRKRWANRLLKQIEDGIPFAKSHPYAVQVWRIGDQEWIALGGEALVDYSLKFREEKSWTTSYFADLTAYIPSRRVWEERGYEVEYLHEYMLPADRWKPDVEDRITEAVERMRLKLQK